MSAKCKVAVAETVYHSRPNTQPTTVNHRYSCYIESEEQPYQRLLKATEEWQPLALGWLAENVGMLHITNTEGENPQLQPSPEELAELAQHVIEIGYSDSPENAWLIRPGESMRAYPSDASKLLIRCRKGTAKYTLFLLPG